MTTDPIKEALCSWRGRVMADAVAPMLEEIGGEPLTAAATKRLVETFDSMFHEVEGHPHLGTFFRACGATFAVTVGALWSERETVTGLTLEFGFRKPAPSDEVRARAKAVGLVGRLITARRDELRVKVPLKGEPGYGKITSRSPDEPDEIEPMDPATTWAAGRKLAGGDGPWLRRYRAGEHEAVWRELFARGDDVRHPDVYGDAVDVVLETMGRAREALALLHKRLKAQGFVFTSGAKAWAPARRGVDGRIAKLEAKVGPLPLSLCGFCSVVGAVDFTGEHPGWTSPGEAILDPLVVSPTAWLLDYDDERWSDGAYALDIAPDRYHKEDISGGPSYVLVAPCAAADTVVEHEDTRPTFVELLRRSLAFGGFPGWHTIDADRRPRELLATLTRDLPAI